MAQIVAEEEAQVGVELKVSAGTRVVAQVDIRSEEAQVEAHVVAQVEVRVLEAREGAQVVSHFEDAANEEAHVKARDEDLLQRQ